MFNRDDLVIVTGPIAVIGTPGTATYGIRLFLKGMPDGTPTSLDNVVGRVFFKATSGSMIVCSTDWVFRVNPEHCSLVFSK